MSTARTQSPATNWLAENGPRELEHLFRAIIYHVSTPVLVTDDKGTSRDAEILVFDMNALNAMHLKMHRMAAAVGEHRRSILLPAHGRGPLRVP